MQRTLRLFVTAGLNAISPGVRLDVPGEAGNPLRGEVGELAIFVGMTRAFRPGVVHVARRRAASGSCDG